MSYNTIYTGSFLENVNSDRIDIYFKQEGFTGEPSTLTLDANPVVISYPTKEWDSQIFGCGCKVNILNQTGNFYQYDTLFSVPERSNYVEIVKTPKSGDASIYLFQGYILPEMYTSKLGKNIQLTIPATDRLSTLDRYTPWILVDTSAYRAQEYITAFDLISSILYDADVTNTISINNSLENKNYVRDTSSTVFNNVWLNTDNFIEQNGSIQDDKKVIEKILKPFYSRCYYNNGRWVIDRVKDMGLVTRRYTTYPKTSPITYTDVSTKRINLSCGNHEVISGSPELTYNPGYQKLILKLNWKQPTNLVENYFYDIQPLDPCYGSKLGYPVPKIRRWMVSNESLLNYAGNYSPPFTIPDVSLWAWPQDRVNGIEHAYWFTSGWGWGTAEGVHTWSRSQTLSTSFEFTKKGTADILDIKYKVALVNIPPNDPAPNDSINSNISLRAVDIDGSDWYIAKSNPNDVSTFWRTTPYVFCASTKWSDIKADQEDQNSTIYYWDISHSIDLTQALQKEPSTISYRVKVHTNEGYWFYPFIEANPRDVWVTKTYATPQEVDFVGQMMLDMYMITANRTTAPTYDYRAFWWGAYIGDIDVDFKAETFDQYLEASIGYWYAILNRELDIFDTSTVNYTNGLYNGDDDILLRQIGAWRDSSAENYIKLQEKYIEDIAQIISKPRYKFKVDVRSKDSSVFSLGYLYNHDALRYPNGDHIDFMCNGLQYNVKENTYRLDLMEYSSDDNWRVSPIQYVFTPSPLVANFDKYGIVEDSSVIDVSTNVDTWTVDTSATWLTLDKVGNKVYITCDQNPDPTSRDASIYFTPNPLLTVTGTFQTKVQQDASTETVYVQFADDGSIYQTGFTDEVARVSFRLIAGINMQSDGYCGYGMGSDTATCYLTDGTVATSVDAQCGPVGTGETDSDYQTYDSYFDISAGTKAMHIDYVLPCQGDYYNCDDKSSYARILILDVSKLSGTADVSKGYYNQFDAYPDMDSYGCLGTYTEYKSHV